MNQAIDSIVFMGTPAFAVPCLQRLVDDGYRVSGVFTQPDKAKGRGYAFTPPPVKVLAGQLDIPVFQPAAMKSQEALDQVSRLKPDLIVVVAYGKILPQSVLDLPRFGCINVHGSLLPKYRGAAPIQWAVLNGERTTGVTTMKMDAGLDTGDMLLKTEVPIGEEDTAGDMHDKLSLAGAQLLSKTLEALGQIIPQPQDNSAFTYAPMLDKSLCPLDFTQTAQAVHNRIRGLSPWPVATMMLGGKRIKVHKSVVTDIKGTTPGAIEEDGRLLVCCGDGRCIELVEVQPENKKRMGALDYARGHAVKKGTIIGR